MGGADAATRQRTSVAHFPPMTPGNALRCSAALLSTLLSACTSAPARTTSGTPIDHATAQASFERVWTIVETTDADPNHGGVDWKAVKAEFQPRVDACTTIEQLRQIEREMLARLGRSHFGLIEQASASRIAPSDDGAGSKPSRAAASNGTMGLDLRVIEDRVVVTNVHADTPAASAHVQRGWIVQRVDGAEPLADHGAHAESGPMARYARDAGAQALDLGSAGSTESWTFLDASGTTHTRSLQRAETSGTPTQIGLLPTFRVRCEDRVLTADELRQLGLDPGLRIAVIGFNIWMPVIAAQFDEAVDRHRDCDGVILDLRGNPGGVGAMAMGIAGHFHDGTDSLGTMRTREASLEFKVNPRRSTADGRSVQPFAGPLAILVDPMSASTSEIFAAGLQSLGRAHVVGRTSAGAALPAQMRELPDGDGLLFAFADFTRPDGSHIEGVGVIPDLPSGDTLLVWQLGNDPDIAAAARWIAAEHRPVDCQ